LPRPIEILFRTRSIRATRTLFGSLQTLGKAVETPLNRALFRALSTLLTLGAIQRLLAFANSIRNSIARQPLSRFL
jgi:hypothetical protein